jgi:chromate reductase
MSPTRRIRLLGIAGSLRAGSYNRALLRAARELAPEDVELVEFDLRSLPHYDGDLEVAGDPEPVRELKDAIRDADALLIATPEYNRGTSGVLKNAIDWASRPPFGSPLTGKPVAIVGASTGLSGTRRAQQQVRDALSFPGADVLEDGLAVTEAYEKFEDDELTDEATREQLREVVEELTDTVRLAHPIAATLAA